ncbi:MAG: hypothetical protein ACRDOU_00500 [Streptosporangiaceae bacterium]
MSDDEPTGVVFPVSPDGRRSTSALGRAVVADALGDVDPAGAKDAGREANWRTGYPTHFRRLIEVGLTSRDAAVAVARGGLESLHRRMQVAGPGPEQAGLGALATAPARHSVATVTVTGTGTADGELSVPCGGERLHGDALRRRCEAWVAAGVIEPSCADAIATVAAHPEWLALPGRTIAVLGAGAEVGPLPVLLGWGAQVMGVDLPVPQVWERVLEVARRSAGTLLVPVANQNPVVRVAEQDPGQPLPQEDGDALAQRAGLDLTDDAPAVADWLATAEDPLVLGNYVYADGAANVRVSSAVDALTVRLQAARPDMALAFLATPTDVFAVPGDAVAQSARAYATRSPAARLGRWPLQALSGGRMLSRAYPPGADPGICDSLIPQQGPNYALAKRIQRWRATVARDAGATVSMNVAPPTRTRSVLKNRALAAAYQGAPRFGVEIFEPATTKTLMAALLVHDLYAGGKAGPAQGHPWQDEAHAAAHGGLWRMGYTPRSAFGLAALLGYGAARRRDQLPGWPVPVLPLFWLPGR